MPRVRNPIRPRRPRMVLFNALLALFLASGCSTSRGPKVDPGGPSVADKLREGDAARALGDTPQALWSYLTAHRLDPKAMAPVERIAMLHLKDSPDRAEALFTQITEESPDSPVGYTGLGLVKLVRGEHTAARALLLKARSLDPDSPATLASLGVTVDQMGFHRQAQVLYDLALQIRPGDYETLNNLGVSYLMSGRYEQAVQALRKALLIERRDLGVQNNLGLALGRLERYDEAMSVFRVAGDEATAQNNLGYTYFLNGQFEAAIEHFERALVLGTEDYRTVIHNLKMARERREKAQTKAPAPGSDPPRPPGA